jgi:formate hydrogenlyase subunit 3/multisubunit Na+/H+ antiporter MnhD subunit
LAISFNDNLTLNEIVFYLVGVILAGAVGYFILYKITRMEKDVDLNRFQGHVYEYPKLAAGFLITCLGLAGFPITSTFIGEDILFSHIRYDQVFLCHQWNCLDQNVC